MTTENITLLLVVISLSLAILMSVISVFNTIVHNLTIKANRKSAQKAMKQSIARRKLEAARVEARSLKGHEITEALYSRD